MKQQDNDDDEEEEDEEEEEALFSTVASTPSPMQPTLLSRLPKVSPIPFMHQRMRC